MVQKDEKCFNFCLRYNPTYTGPAKKCIHTLTKETSTLIIDYCKSTIYFRQHNNICIYFNITYIVILATCFDSYESSLGINIQELLVHIVLQFFMS